MRDLYNNIGLTVAIPAAVYTADNTPAAIDLKGFEAAVVTLSIGVGGITFSTTNKIEFVLTHSDDDATYTAVQAADVQGPASVGTGGIVLSLTAAQAAATVAKIGYIGNKRFLKLLGEDDLTRNYRVWNF